MVQVDACGWVVCGKEARYNGRCSEHQNKNPVENIEDTVLFSIVMGRLRAGVANELAQELLPTAHQSAAEHARDSILELLQALYDRTHEDAVNTREGILMAIDEVTKWKP